MTLEQDTINILFLLSYKIKYIPFRARTIKEIREAYFKAYNKKIYSNRISKCLRILFKLDLIKCTVYGNQSHYIAI